MHVFRSTDTRGSRSTELFPGTTDSSRYPIKRHRSLKGSRYSPSFDFAVSMRAYRMPTIIVGTPHDATHTRSDKGANGNTCTRDFSKSEIMAREMSGDLNGIGQRVKWFSTRLIPPSVCAAAGLKSHGKCLLYLFYATSVLSLIRSLH